MRAVLFPAADEVRMADLPQPLPGRGEAVVRVRASGLCHTDVEVMHGRYGTGAFPLAPGHEFAGEVAAAGEGVSIAEGTRVVVDPNLSCGTESVKETLFKSIPLGRLGCPLCGGR